MAGAQKTDYQNVKIGNENGVLTTEGLFFSLTRLNHVHTHQIQLQSRVNTPHGIWATNNATYGNQMMLILSYADRAIRRVRRNSSKVVNTVVQGNGRTAYDVKLISAGSIGTSCTRNQHGGTHTVFADHARLVVEAAINYNGNNVIPVVTFFPIS
ncbi:MAG: hypothetical protein LUM44_04615 [Pyrinomonadaceae bacterium]|nr:hypothetical protein [Pyrinomonadaceae bacterium]